MNDPKSDAKLATLFAQARVRRTNTSAIEYGFETRLMARIRSEKGASSIWAMVSWRMMPFFAACVLALTVWRGEVVNDADDAEQSAAVGNPSSVDSLGTLEL